MEESPSSDGRFKRLEYLIENIKAKAAAAFQAVTAGSNNVAAMNANPITSASVVFQQPASVTKPKLVSHKFRISATIHGTGTSTNSVTVQMTFNGAGIGPIQVVDVDAEGNFAACIDWIDASGTTGTFLQYGLTATSSAAALTIPTGHAAVTLFELPG